MKKQLCVVLTICIVLSCLTLFVACQKTVTTVTFSETEVYMVVGDSMPIPVTLEPTDGQVTFQTANDKLLKIEDGTMVALSTDGNNMATTFITATNEEGTESHLSVYIYRELDDFLQAVDDSIYVVYRVYNSSTDTWRVGDIDYYFADAYVNAPTNVIPQNGYNLEDAWYEDEARSIKVVFQQKKITESFALYTSERLRDGSSEANGEIDLNVAYDRGTGVYTVTGLTYPGLRYRSITIPETYRIFEDNEWKTVRLEGIANNAFYYNYTTDNKTFSNKELQYLQEANVMFVKYIGDNAFRDCLALETVRLDRTIIQNISSTAFSGTGYTFN